MRRKTANTKSPNVDGLDGAPGFVACGASPIRLNSPVRIVVSGSAGGGVGTAAGMTTLAAESGVLGCDADCGVEVNSAAACVTGGALTVVDGGGVADPVPAALAAARALDGEADTTDGAKLLWGTTSAEDADGADGAVLDAVSVVGAIGGVAAATVGVGLPASDVVGAGVVPADEDGGVDVVDVVPLGEVVVVVEPTLPPLTDTELVGEVCAPVVVDEFAVVDDPPAVGVDPVAVSVVPVAAEPVPLADGAPVPADALADVSSA